MRLKEDAEAEQRQLIGPNYEFTWLQLPKTVKKSTQRFKSDANL